MQKVKISMAVKTATSTQTARFESNIPTANKPATPLQTLIAAATHLAQMAEIYEGAGDVLVLALGDAVQAVKERAK